MNADPLIENPSDAGGVSARAGFRFQDHAGAGILLDMLVDSSTVAVEFETADDITLRIIDEIGPLSEYIQVKTTEANGKWNLKELTERASSNGKKIEWSSLCEKSLACDKFSDRARFRLVTKRDVATNLKPFCVQRDNRQTVGEKIATLVTNFSKKYKKSVSEKGRHLGDWAASLYWHVAGSSDALENQSINRILRLCEGRGASPLYSMVEAIYEDLMKQVRKASDASRMSEPLLKSIGRKSLLLWWEDQIVKIRATSHVTMKVYEVLPEPFLTEFSLQNDGDINRSMTAYDVEFDEGIWRIEELCDYLLDWLPEITLPSSTLSHFNRFNARELLPKAKTALKGKSIDNEGLLAETLLHAIMRNHLGSEPIPCRLFSLDDGTATSAHIVFHASGDQLWLGRPSLLPLVERDKILKEIVSRIEAAVTSGVLKKEREFALSLRQPLNSRPTTIQALLSNRAKIEDLRKVVRLPVLLAYESPHLGKSFYEDYLTDLIAEADVEYQAFKELLPDSLLDVSVAVFLIPVPNVANLTRFFEKALN
ncbi:dsDNA nuclease domain-containing protein [Pseudosulfitobacter sp. SM2401]|uniref:dsDNA nuclease domain-containing protein n=1 Tax=Pseudosulfitobacter sp. SM2401 TaxID=3350098 RepID=UPI0036F2D6D0